MKFPNFSMNKWFLARAFVLLVSFFLLASAASAQKMVWTSLVPTAQPDVDQCANKDGVAPPNANLTCDWQNGNLNESNSVYREGDSVPYRTVFTGLTSGQTVTFSIEYDTTESGGQHAIDYLTTYTRTVTNADPCEGVTPNPCGGTSDTEPIPLDTRANNICGCVVAGDFTVYGGTGLAVQGPFYTGPADYSAATTASYTVTFTASGETAVLTWGGHISERPDWFPAPTAVNMSGSPYHMRRLGGTDRSLKVSSVLFGGIILIEKTAIVQDQSTNQVYTTSNQTFNFTSSRIINGNSTSFSLMDLVNEPFSPVDLAAREGGETSLNNAALIFDLGASNLVTINEDPNNAGTLVGITCTSEATSNPTVNNNTVTATGVQVQLEEGEIVRCKFHNSLLIPTAAPASVTGRVTNGSGMGLRGVYVTLTNASTGQMRTVITNTFGNYTFTDLEVGNFYTMTVESKRYAFDAPVRSFTLTQDLAGINFVSSE